MPSYSRYVAILACSVLACSAAHLADNRAGAEVIRRRSHSDYDSGGIYYRTVAPTPAYFPPCIPKASVPHFVDGVISTGSEPYPPNARCEWSFPVRTEGATAKLEFESFSVEQGFDFVRVFNGAELTAVFSGIVVPPSTTVPAAELRIVFGSDSSVQAGGFLLRYDLTDPKAALWSETRPVYSPLDFASTEYSSGSDPQFYAPPAPPTWRDTLYAPPDSAFTPGAPLEPRFASIGNPPTTIAPTYAAHGAEGCAGETRQIAPRAGQSGPIRWNGDLFTHVSLRCEWLVSACAYGGAVELSFTSFSLEQGYDWVDVYDGTDLAGSYTGRDMPPSFTSTGCMLRVVLRTDLSVGANGFVARYTTKSMASKSCIGPGYGTPGKADVAFPLLSRSGDVVVGLWGDGKGGNVHDSARPFPITQYDANMRCEWVVAPSCGPIHWSHATGAAPSHCASVCLHIEALELEQGYDFLHVYDGDALVKSLSGKLSSPLQLSSTSGKMRLVFTSDGTIQDSGFVVRYDSRGVGGCTSASVARLVHAPRESSIAGMPIEEQSEAQPALVWLGVLAAVCVVAVILGAAMRHRRLQESRKKSATVAAKFMQVMPVAAPAPVFLFGDADVAASGVAEDDMVAVWGPADEGKGLGEADDRIEDIALPTDTSVNRLGIKHVWTDMNMTENRACD